MEEAAEEAALAGAVVILEDAAWIKALEAGTSEEAIEEDTTPAPI